MSIQVMLIDKNGITRMYNSPNPPAPEILFPVLQDLTKLGTYIPFQPPDGRGYLTQKFRRNCTSEPYIYEEV